MAGDFDFSVEAQEISNEIKEIFAKETFNSDIMKNLQLKVDKVIFELDEATKLLSIYKTQKNAFKRLQKSMSKNMQGLDIQNLSEEEFILAFEEYNGSKKNRSQTFKTNSSLMEFFESRKQFQDTQKIKKYLISSYNLIMEVRNSFKEHIEYRIFITGKNSRGKDVILMASPSLSELTKTANITSNLDLQLSLTTKQIKDLINDYEKNTGVGAQLQEVFSEDNEVWQLLQKVREKIIQISKNGKKIYYNFGQLIEALNYLKEKEINTNNIYQALIQGLNTVSFEKQGDFILNGVDIQSKVFNVSGNEYSLHRIRLMSLSNVKRVLINIKNALKSSYTFNEFQAKMKIIFQDDGVQNSIWSGLESEVKSAIEEVLKQFEKDKNLTTKI